LFNIAAASQTLAIDWIESFLLFIDDAYVELTVACFSTAKVWNLIAHLDFCILQDIATPRYDTINAFAVGDYLYKHIFCSVFQSQDITIGQRMTLQYLQNMLSFWL
jgi:hypothetical protein